jgi:hypothetical protein
MWKEFKGIEVKNYVSCKRIKLLVVIFLSRNSVVTLIQIDDHNTEHIFVVMFI